MANATVMDPVCGMEINPEEAAGTSEYMGTTYYFCAPGCKKQFDRNPEQYVVQEGKDTGVSEDHEHHGHHGHETLLG
jgi:YHS domain-containing protein